MTNETQKKEGYSTREIIIAVVVTLVIVMICVASAVVGYSQMERLLVGESTQVGADVLETQSSASQEEGDVSVTTEGMLQPGEGTGGTGSGTTSSTLAMDAAGLALCGGVLVIGVGGIFLLDRYYRTRSSKI